MSWLYLRKPGYPYSACGPFTKHLERIQIFWETSTLKNLHRNKTDKACFDHDAVYSDSIHLAKRTILDKVLKDKAYEFARNPKYHGYHRRFASMVYKIFVKKTGSDVSINEDLAGELSKAVIKKIKARTVYARFKDNIRESDFS